MQEISLSCKIINFKNELGIEYQSVYIFFECANSPQTLLYFLKFIFWVQFPKYVQKLDVSSMLIKR